MSLWAKIRGTAETIFQLGLGGPQWNANAGAIEAKNAADNAFAIVRGATAVGASDLVPLAQLPSGAGRLLKVTLVTASSGNFTTTASTNSVQIFGQGAGGGGAGVTNGGALTAACGGGGGSGAWLRKFTAVTPSTNYAFTCGAPGTTGSGAAGGNGGSSTFIIGATTYTCPGGGGAPLANASTTVTTAFAGGVGAAVATNGDVNSGGSPGQPGFLATVTPLGFSGSGASSPFGGGGAGTVNAASSNGGAANGFGAGGGGASGAGIARTGGTPTGGCWLVEEYS